MIQRSISAKLRDLAEKFPVLSLTGPRQSGKTTLLKAVFAEKAYVSLEDLDTRSFAQKDPRGFLKTYPDAIIDEAQQAPDLFSYIQTAVDAANKPGQYILSGSQNFLLLERISQSLSGRVGILKLLPFSYKEIESIAQQRPLDAVLYTGFYPRIFDRDIAPEDFHAAYVQTYIERDIRLLKNITDLGLFQRFVKLCAGRCGQLLNLSSLANDCGISHTTARAWIAILEASYMIFLLQPHHRNFNKRLVKSPKLYFYDTGLAAHLLGIESAEQLATHYARGALFESFIIAELLKARYNAGKPANCYYWRNKTGDEIDCLIEREGRLHAVEIKSGQTIQSGWFKNLAYFASLAEGTPVEKTIIYGGTENQQRTAGTVMSWKNACGVNT